MRDKAETSWASHRFVAAVLFLAPLISLPKSLPMAPILGLVAVIMLAGPGWTPSRRAHLHAGLMAWRPTLLPIAALLAWVFAACWWSFNPAFSLKSLGMLVGTVAGGLVFARRFDSYSADQQRPMVEALAAGLGLAALAMTVVGVLDRTAWVAVGRLAWDMDSDTTVIALLVWPVAGWLIRFGQCRKAMGLLVLALIGVVVVHDLAAKLAMVLGGAAWLVGRWRPRPLLAAIAALAIVGSLLAPVVATHIPPPEVSARWSWLPGSAHHRLTIWSFTARHIAEKPLFGWGYDGARAIPGGKTIVPVVRLAGCPQAAPPVELPGYDRPIPGDCVLWEESLPLHPHDAWLQVWLELGAVGAGLIAWLLWRLILPVGSGRRDGQAVAAATLTAGLLICSVSFGVWQSWWLSTLWIAGGLVLPLLRPAPEAAGCLGNPQGLG